MIQRLIALLVLLYALGYVWFAALLPRPADLRATDAIVVLTGARGRIDRGLDLLERRKARRMLISGVDRTVRPVELAIQAGRDRKLFECCIDLGRESVDTRSNAEETADWVRTHIEQFSRQHRAKITRSQDPQRHFRSCRFVTTIPNVMKAIAFDRGS